ncbi:Uncharacterized protein CG5098 [Eumeta japonica]|uniref:Uncharacterized protein CG5098 n=1 Tax=Eumeta variegata TaxID=151549 RepID=A0A4C1VNE0_EUMVA|nr:Uncharacterized protein CG5098 [Eumeta japonica]
MTVKPSKLEDHLRRCHPDEIGKDLKYFQTLKVKYEKRPTAHSMFSSTSESNNDGLRASYINSLLIAKFGKPNTIGEQLILPAVEEIVRSSKRARENVSEVSVHVVRKRSYAGEGSSNTPALSWWTEWGASTCRGRAESALRKCRCVWRPPCRGARSTTLTGDRRRSVPLGTRCRKSVFASVQLQMASYLARAPQAHLASERGVTWHTPTPPPRLYHVPATSPPEPLQAMKVGGSAVSGGPAGPPVFRHAGTPPELFRHTPTPPDKHAHRHTPSPGDMKAAAILPPADLYSHLGQQRDKIVRAEDMLSYARSVAGAGVDLSLTRVPLPSAATAPPPPAANGAPLSLSVRDAPTINSLIARAQPRHPPHHARVDQLLERLVPSPVSPHSVIVHSRAAPTPSPPSSNEDSADSCGAPPGAKRKRKPDRTVRVPAPTPPTAAATPPPQPLPPRLSPPPPAFDDQRSKPTAPVGREQELRTDTSPPVLVTVPTSTAPPVVTSTDHTPLENGDATHDKMNGPDIVDADRQDATKPLHTRRKTRSGSAETIDDIAAMIADPDPGAAPPAIHNTETDAPTTVDSLKSVLSSVDHVKPEKKSPKKSPSREREEQISNAEERTTIERAAAVAPRRRSARSSNAEAPNVPVESPSEGRPAESEPTTHKETGEPVAASFVEVENQLQKMFAGLEEETSSAPAPTLDSAASGRPEPPDSGRTRDSPIKRRRSAIAKNKKKRKTSTVPSTDGLPPNKKKTARKKGGGTSGRLRARSKEAVAREAYDSGSNASGASRSRGPYIQIRGPRDSPLSVNVVNATGSAGADDDSEGAHRSRVHPQRAKTADGELRNGLRTRGLHCSTLSLRYDATTPDASWVCAFCERGPHAGAAPGAGAGPEPRPLGDLFGPYTISTDCEEFRELDETTRRRASPGTNASPGVEVWVHEECAVWAPGVLAGGLRVWGLESAVWNARGVRCVRCGRGGAAIACGVRGCPQRTHVWCARVTRWTLDEDRFRAVCPKHH